MYYLESASSNSRLPWTKDYICKNEFGNKMIQLSIDRIAQIYNYDVPDTMDNNEYGYLVMTTWVEKVRKIIAAYIPEELTLLSNGNNYSIQFSYQFNRERPEPLINISFQQYVKGIRLDFNPKRMRDNLWLKQSMNDIKLFAKENGYKGHNTQIDLAFDLFDEGIPASNMEIFKQGLKRTGIFNSVNGDIETQYYGVRGSSSFVRIYNKHQEQLSHLSKKYRALKSRILSDFDSIISKSGINEPDLESIINLLEPYKIGKSPFNNLNITNIDDFKIILEWTLGKLRQEEEDNIPKDWKRFEIVLRSEKLSNDKITFDDNSVYSYLNAVVNTELSTISDYNLRALAMAIEAGKVQVTELSLNEKARYRKIMKHDEIVVFKTISSGAQRIMSIDEFNEKIDPEIVVSEKHITKHSDNSLRDKMKTAFELKKNDLKSELNSYTI